MKFNSALLLSVLFVGLACAPASAQKTGVGNGNDSDVLDAVAAKKDLYPADAEANREIAGGLARAVAEQKRVLLVFGANWCYDCHVLDQALHTGNAGKILSDNYVLVHVDIGEGDKNLDLVKRYKIPLEKGVPALVVLKSDGEMIYWSGYGEFESARRMMKKDLIAFLNHWKQTAMP